ncbi:CARDB domain-containing protein [Haloplanus sp.]|uniref:CARDB domain-containing protein n=1 Tax=Haloplanus sp. TaxID=1961696 RepID=UPI002606BF6C|nr:CARDB domain-containing protein [Haloplanus sp.]
MSLTLLALLGVVGAATAVPDARVGIDQVEVSSGEPAVGERTSLNVTISNSGGSPAAANVTSVRLYDTARDGDPRDEATTVGALSAGDTTTVVLWTRFDEPGAHRLTVEVVAEQEATDDEDDGGTVTVTRDVIVDVQPAEVALDLRTRALAPEDLQRDNDDQSGGQINVGGIDGILGGGGGLQAGDDDESDSAASADSPVAVTVVNTGTATADRVSLTAVGTSADPGGGADAASNGADPTVAVGPFVVEDLAPGEERRVVIDLGPLDERSNVTVSATFRSELDAAAGASANRTATSSLLYPTREGRPSVTDATVRTTGDGEVRIDANLGNAGTGELTGVIVSVTGADGVEPTPAGQEYFVGTVAAGDFVAFDLQTAANASVADAVPIRIAYTERGVRYTETVTVALPEPDDGSDTEASTVGTLETIGIVGLIGGGGIAIAGSVIRRRDV